MKKILLLTCLSIALCASKGPELPIDLLYKRWIITKIDPTAMPTWATMSQEGKNANLRINNAMIERGSFYAFEKGGKADILVYNLFHKASFCNVATTYTYSKQNQYITLQAGEKVDENGDTFRVPDMAYKIEKLTRKELVLVVVQNNYKLYFKVAK